MTDSFEYIRNYYHVPARRGAIVTYKGQRGKVTGTSGQYVLVKLDFPKHSLPYHPKDLQWEQE